MPSYSLLATQGPRRGAVLPLQAGSHDVGRRADAAIPLLDLRASRQHARIIVGPEWVRVQDLNSRNGTWVEGLPVVDEEVPALPGHQVRFAGETFLLAAGEVAGWRPGLLGRTTIISRDRQREPSETPTLQEAVVASPIPFVARSPAMQPVLRLIRRAAPYPSPLLITGEAGTGKERVAEALHRHGSRRHHPLVRLNCALLEEEMLQRELFGHEQGAFTGAAARRQGLMELADGGTLFLDEVGALPLDVQARVLRALERKEFRRVGAAHQMQVDVRVVAATRRDLAAAVREGTFREELLYRLKAVEIPLPPLRERPEDVEALACHFLTRFNEVGPGTVEELSPGALKALGRYRFPGNVRELRNLVERAVMMADGPTIEPEHLPPQLFAPDRQAGDFPTLRELEARHLSRALQRTGGNQAAAARLLGVDRSTIHDLIRRHRVG